MNYNSLEVLNSYIPLMTMLKDENRQQIVVLLCKNESLKVNDIAKRLLISRPAVSHHLNLMLDKDIVYLKKVGNKRYYSINLDSNLYDLKSLTKVIQ